MAPRIVQKRPQIGFESRTHSEGVYVNNYGCAACEGNGFFYKYRLNKKFKILS